MRLGPLPCKGLSLHPGCRFSGAQGLSVLSLGGLFCLHAKQGGVGCGWGQCLGAVPRVTVSFLSPWQQVGWRAPSPACPITPAPDRVGSLQHRAPLRSLRPSQPESGGQWKAPGFWTRPGTMWTLGREATGSFPLKHSRAPVQKDSPGHPATSELQGPPQ